MENKETICAVVVTYNRKDLLIECLAAICKQTKPVDAIYIIDNFSNDGTANLLLENGYIKGLPPENLTEPFEMEIDFDDNLKIYYVRINENTGGAGGFHEGVKRGYERGYDWLWLMDDDGLPEEKCLELLLAKKNVAHYIAPLVLRIDKKDEMSFGLGENLMTIEDCKKSAEDGILRNVANPFNGILISKELVFKVGLPKKEMFIWGDEFEYMLRSIDSLLGVITVLDAIFYHPKSKTEFKEIKGTKFKVAFKSGDIIKSYIMIRNYAYINFKYNKKGLIKSFILYSLFFLSNLDVKGFWLYLSAVRDGIFEKFGNEKRYLK